MARASTGARGKAASGAGTTKPAETTVVGVRVTTAFKARLDRVVEALRARHQHHASAAPFGASAAVRMLLERGVFALEGELADEAAKVAAKVETATTETT